MVASIAKGVNSCELRVASITTVATTLTPYTRSLIDAPLDRAQAAPLTSFLTFISSLFPFNESKLRITAALQSAVL